MGSKSIDNVRRRAERVRELAYQYYEPGRLDRCWRWVWRYKVDPVYPCSYRTFMRYLHWDKHHSDTHTPIHQPTLFD